MRACVRESRSVMSDFLLSLVTKACSTLCDPMGCNASVSSIHGILQARILEWWPFPSPGDLPSSGIELASPALAGGLLSTEPPGKSS